MTTLTCRDAVETILDALLRSHDRLVRCEIDASACQTHADWQRLHEAQDDHATSREAAVRDLVQLIKDAQKGVS
jgi:hypothetical protein